MANSTKVKRKFCISCGTELFDVARNTQRCEFCAQWRKLEYDRKYMRRKRLKHRMCGTTDFSAHRNIDFDKELREIEYEMKFLGLKKSNKKVLRTNI